MARAATSISGTNTSPALNLSPITPMAGTSAPFRMASGSTPSAERLLHERGHFLLLPALHRAGDVFQDSHVLFLSFLVG